MSLETQDHGNANEEFSILLPGDTPQGGGETEATSAGASQAGDDEHVRAAMEAAGVKPAEPNATSTVDPQILEALRKLDPTSLPEDVVRHLDRHLLPDYTRKTQALADERRAFEQQRGEWFARMEKLLDRVGTNREQPGDRDRLSDLREKVRGGDLEALDSYVEELANRKVAPIQSTMALRTAYETAEQAEPLVKQHAEEIGAIIRSNPDVVSLIMANNYQHAPLVFQALARDVELRKAQQTIASFEDRMRDAVSKGIEAYKARVRGLPQTTTQAGTTTTGPQTVSSPKTFEEARARTLEALKGMGVA
jgi:hypothetical protein